MAVTSAKTQLTQLLAKPSINQAGNDYSARLRGGPLDRPGRPGPRVAYQVKLGKGEATKLASAVKRGTGSKAFKKAVVTELLARTRNTRNNQFGGVALTRDAAAVLNRYAASLGITGKFEIGRAHV